VEEAWDRRERGLPGAALAPRVGARVAGVARMADFDAVVDHGAPAVVAGDVTELNLEAPAAR